MVSPYPLASPLSPILLLLYSFVFLFYSSSPVLFSKVWVIGRVIKSGRGVNNVEVYLLVSVLCLPVSSRGKSIDICSEVTSVCGMYWWG